MYCKFQTTIINYIENDISELESYLPYLNRSWRLVELAKCYFIAMKNEPDMTLIWEETDQARFRHNWTYNPYVHWLIDPQDSSNFDALIFIDVVEDFAAYHSVLPLLIKGSLSTSQPDDYLIAFLEYCNIIACSPWSTCSRLDAIRRGLGSYLLSSSSSSNSHSKKKWTRLELIHAMIPYGRRHGSNATQDIKEIEEVKKTKMDSRVKLFAILISFVFITILSLILFTFLR